MNEAEYRRELERRMQEARQHRGDLDRHILDLTTQREELDERVRAMEAHYRFEFRDDPPESDVPPAVAPTRRSRIGQPSWREAIVATLREEGGPLHVKEIWNRMQQGGFQTSSADPVRSIVSTAIRMDEIHRAGPNTFAINDTDTSRGSQGSLSITAAEA